MHFLWLLDFCMTSLQFHRHGKLCTASTSFSSDMVFLLQAMGHTCTYNELKIIDRILPRSTENRNWVFSRAGTRCVNASFASGRDYRSEFDARTQRVITRGNASYCELGFSLRVLFTIDHVLVRACLHVYVRTCVT